MYSFNKYVMINNCEEDTVSSAEDIVMNQITIVLDT